LSVVSLALWLANSEAAVLTIKVVRQIFVRLLGL